MTLVPAGKGFARVEARLLQRFCSGSIGEPRVENFQLLLDRIYEYDAHAVSLVDVNDLSIRHESLTVAGNDNPEESVYGKGARGVHVTSLAADFRHSSHNAHCARGFDEFRDGENRITPNRALNDVRLA